MEGMIKTLILRVLLAVTAATAGCGGRSPLESQDAAPVDTSGGGGDGLVRGDALGDPGKGDGAREGADAPADLAIDLTPDAPADGAQPSPLNIPGVVVWLDADVGIDAPGTDQMTWTDRSPYGHVFMAQSADDAAPTVTRLNGHRAVRFSGHNRFISEQAPTPAQRDALSLRRDFIVALVLLPETEVPHDAILTRATLPWIGSPPLTIDPLPPTAPTFSIDLKADPSLSLQAGAARLRLGGDYLQSSQRLILSAQDGKRIRVLINGQLQTATPEEITNPSDGDYAPIYLGSWDFGTLGFEGVVAEMIVVRGSSDPATEQVLDDYFKAKFSL